MAGAYSQDVPDRVIDAVIGGKISRRAAAARFGVSLSSAIKWVQRFERTGSRRAATMAGYKRVKVEPRRGVSRGSAGRETRHHAHGAVREAFNRARRQGGHLDDEPVPPPDRRHAQTKTLIGRARDRPDIRRHRRRWRASQKRVDPSRLLVLAESSTKTNLTRLHGLLRRAASGSSTRSGMGIGTPRPFSPPCATPASRRPACSTVRSTASAFAPRSSRS